MWWIWIGWIVFFKVFYFYQYGENRSLGMPWVGFSFLGIESVYSDITCFGTCFPNRQKHGEKHHQNSAFNSRASPSLAWSSKQQFFAKFEEWTKKVPKTNNFVFFGLDGLYFIKLGVCNSHIFWKISKSTWYKLGFNLISPDQWLSFTRLFRIPVVGGKTCIFQGGSVFGILGFVTTSRWSWYLAGSVEVEVFWK